MDKLPAPPKEKDLPAPNEKLLRTPTFSEKYGSNITAFVIIFLLLIGVAIYSGKNTNTAPLPAKTLDQSTLYPPATKPTATHAKANWKTYTNTQGQFSLMYPDGYLLNDTSAYSKDSIQITSPVLPKINTNFTMTITYSRINGDETLSQLIAQYPLCPIISSQKGQYSIINGTKEARLYADTDCGRDVKTVVYTLNNNIFYVVTVESSVKFADIKKYTDAIFTTLRFDNVTMTTLSPSKNEGTLCTMETIECPDGSLVGRSGPKCEFATCTGLKK